MTDSTARPNMRAVVEMLMRKLPDVTCDVQPKKGGREGKNVWHYQFACPLGDECKKDGKVKFEKGTGYTNPFKHLVSYVSDGDVDHLYRMYHAALAQERRSGILNRKEFVSVSLTANEKERAMHAYIELVVELNLELRVSRTEYSEEMCYTNLLSLSSTSRRIYLRLLN